MYYVHTLNKTANIIKSTTIHTAQISACFWSCLCLIVLISKLALLCPGQEPILIWKDFFCIIKKRKDKPAHSSINVHWEGAQKPHCLHGGWRGRVKSWSSHAASVHVYEGGGESRQQVVLLPDSLAPSRCLPAHLACSGSPLSFLSKWLIYPQSSLFSLHIMG